MSSFAELAITTNFSFLRAGSHPEEFVEQAKALGLAGIGVADRCTLAGVVRAHVAAKEHKVRLIVGARLVFTDGTPDIVAYPKDKSAYQRLTRLLTIGNRRAPKGECHLCFADFLAACEGLQAIVFGAVADEKLADLLTQIRKAAGAVWLAIPARLDGLDARRRRELKAIASAAGACALATTEPLIHCPERKPLLDVVTCIREKTTLDNAGRLLEANAERHLKPPEEIARLYRDIPEAVDETIRFMDGIDFSMDKIGPQYPEELRAGFATPQDALETLAWNGAHKRYPNGIPEKISESLKRELEIVAELEYAPYFLTVEDIVRFARGPIDHEGSPRDPILCQGRGSAANSTICYCLGITEVDPAVNELLFDRFVSTERREPPDIDVDFEHERREDVIQYIYKKYTRHRAGLAATLICYRGRSAVREVGKVFGYSQDRIASLAKLFQWWTKDISQEDLRRQGFDPRDERLMQFLHLSDELQGFPRHLSQHVGGFVITSDRLDEVVPIQNAAMEDRTVVEWDKDDLDALHILKVDVLGLGMLSCLKKAFDLLAKHYASDKPPSSIASIPPEDRAVYEMLSRADSIGVFQVESRAQMSMLPRLRPEKFYDLVIEVAIVRPGPIQGGMVHPYLKRKQGIEPESYPSPQLKDVLERTLGVPLFQEQAMQIAIVAAGFTPPEADKLRRAMATFRRVGTIGQLKTKFIEGMVDKGYSRDFAEACFRQVEGFGDYGFPESHAASFALLVYASAWIKCHYPDVFAAAILNAQPMGFYAPAQLVRDAADHGVEIRPVDINSSEWDSILESGPRAAAHLHARHGEMKNDVVSTHGLRIGFRQIKGLREEELALLAARRGRGYDSIRDLWLRTGLSLSAIETLADADAFGSLGLSRREALYIARGIERVGGQENLPLFNLARDLTHEPDFALPRMPLGEEIVADYDSLTFSLRAHPAALLRSTLRAQGVTPAERLAALPDGARVKVAGLVLVRQRPGTAKGVIFMTLEDETHIANIIVWPKTFELYRAEVLGAQFATVEGRLQNQSGVIHVVADRVINSTALLALLSDGTPAALDHVQAAMPGGRNFH